MNYLGDILHCDSPTFAALASWREIFRVSVAALPRLFFVVLSFLGYCLRARGFL